ncbi:hypothetical protein [Halorussus salinus]|uniref:hypothetical protein n=1 Tax=Halorussus salinus TaxID=1364935 RepID=UPI001091E685|nr:hypothetical protein [Halorussus salinus]
MTVVVGAPHIGKTERFDDLADEAELTCVDSLSAADESTGPVVVDDFYTAYQHATPDDRREFHNTLADASQLCLSTRPRDLDWLCTTDLDTDANGETDADSTLDTSSTADHDLATVLREALDTLIVLSHPSDTPQDWEGVDESVSADTLETYADRLTYDYALDSAGLLAGRLADATYGPTLVPPVALALTADTDTATQGWPTGSLREYIGATGLSMATTPFKTLGEKAAEYAQAITSGEVTVEADIDRETVADLAESAAPTAVSALSGSMPFVVAFGLLLWRANPGNDMADLADDLFDHLLDDRLTPLDKARLETGLGLPPRTLDTLDSIDDHVESQFIDAFATLPALQSDVETMQADLRDHRDRLETVEDELADLTDEVYGRREKATEGLAHLETRLQNEEEVLLGERVHPDDVEYLPDEDGNEVDQLRDRLEDDTTDVVVLRGPHGSGKTTAAYKACRELSDDSNYEVRLPRFGEATTVEQVIESSDKHTILYANYQTEVGLGAAGDNERQVEVGTVASGQQLRELQSWSCDHGTVVIECRDELHNSFADKAPKKFAQAERDTREDAATITFERFDKKADAVRETTRWALDVLDYEGEYEAVVDEVVALADGNIEIAKLAARYAATEGEQLSAFGSAMELVHHDVQPVLDADADHGDVGEIYEQVCVTPGVQTRELGDLFEGNITKCAKTLAGYLGGDITDAENATDDADDGETAAGWHDYGPSDTTMSVNPEDSWRPRPIIYGRAVVEYEVFRTTAGNVQQDPSEIEEDLDKYLQRYEATDNPEFALVRLARSLGGLYGRARQRDADDLANAIYKVGVKWLLTDGVNDRLAISDDMDDEGVARRSDLFVRTIRTLLFHDVPVPATIFEQNNAQFFISARIEADRVDTDPTTVTETLLAYALTNSRDIGPEQLTALQSLLPELATACNDAFNEDPSQFLANVYAMALSNLADKSVDPDGEAVTEWVDDLEERAQAMAGRHDVHNDSAGQFLANVYAMAFSNLADKSANPDGEAVTEWVDDLEERAQAMAGRDDAHDLPAGQFLVNVYAMALKKLVDKEANPDGKAVTEWVDELEQRANVMAGRNDAHDLSAGQFLENVYAMALKKLVDKEANPDGKAVTEWVDELEQRANVMAGRDDAHDLSAGQFLMNVYAMALEFLATKSADPDGEAVTEWVDHIAEQVDEVAASDTHSKAQVEFVAWTYGFGVAQVLSGESDGATAWGQTIVDHAVETLPHSELNTIYDAAHAGLRQEPNPDGLVWLVDDVLNRTAEAESPIRETREQRVELVSGFVADIAENTWSAAQRDGFESEVFRAIIARVGMTAEPSVEFFHDVVSRVADSLVDADTDDADTGAGASGAWLARVYPTALAVVADADSITSDDLDTIHEQGRDTLEDASRITLAEYHARALGRVPRDAVADWHDRAATRACNDLGADAPTALYRVGLQHVRDGNPSIAMRCLAGVWRTRDVLSDDASTVTERVGVGYAAHLALDIGDADVDAADVLDALPDETNDHPAAVRTVAAVLDDREPAVTPDELRAGINSDADSHSLTDLETLAYSNLLAELTRTPRDDYETALRLIARDGDAQTVISLLGDVWEQCDEVEEDSDDYVAVLSGGVLLAAHTPVVGPDVIDADPDAIRETVAPHRSRLSDPVQTLFDLLRGEQDAVDLDALRVDVDTDSDELDIADLETHVVAQLVEILQSAPETPDVWEVYETALSAIVENEAQDAVAALVRLWEQRDEIEEDSDDYVAVLSGGVLLAAHALVAGPDIIDADPDAICETVDSHRDRFPDSMRTLLAYLADDAPDADPEEMRERADTDDPEFEDLETSAVAVVLDMVMRHDEDVQGDETEASTAAAETDSNVREDSMD